MRVLIIEDEPLAAERLTILLREYDPSIIIMEVLDSVQRAKSWLETRRNPDIIFLDIELADGQCFPLLQSIRPDCPVIFTTAYDQFALDAFQHFSLDYLLKPISAEKLGRALHRYRNIYSQFPLAAKESVEKIQSIPENPPYKNRFLIKNGSRLSFIDISEIAYFYADNKTVCLVNQNGLKFMIDFTLEHLEMILDPRNFFRFNRKVIGSVSSIQDIRTYYNSRLRISLKAGNHLDEAIVSRERVQAFREWADA